MIMMKISVNWSIFQEESNNDEIKNDNKSYKIKIEENNPNVIIEEKNPYYFKELFNILYNDYLKNPNYAHFFNIENLFRFLEKEMTCNRNNEIEKNDELNDILINGKDVMTMVYKNNNKGIKLFGNKFFEMNSSNQELKLEINNNFYPLMEVYSKCDSNIEEVKITLHISDKVKAINMTDMFSDCVDLKSLYGISKWTTKITGVDRLFYNCNSLSFLPDISEWDVSGLESISLMFYNCYSLIYPFPNLSSWTKNNKYLKKNNYVFIGFSFPDDFKEIPYIIYKKKRKKIRYYDDFCQNFNWKKYNSCSRTIRYNRKS